MTDRAVEIEVAWENAHLFTDKFLEYLPENLHVYAAFTREALKIANRGFRHYSSRTIIHVLRHHSAVAETGDVWKINNNYSPYFARLFNLLHPEYEDLWEMRRTPAAERDGELV